MIPGFFAGGAIRAGHAVAFIAAAGTNYIASGTTISSPSSPAGIANGDGLYAFIFARSALTPPAGWTLVVSKANTGTLTQTLYVYRKNTVSTSDASTAFNWTQASSGRMGLAYMVVRSSSGSITEAQTGTAETDYASSTAYPQNVTVPTLTATADGELFLIAATAEAASATPNTSTWTSASGATLRSTATQPENRLVVGTQGRKSGQSNSTPMTLNTSTGGAGVNYYSAIIVRLQP